MNDSGTSSHGDEIQPSTEGRTAPVRVLLVEDHPIVTRGLEGLIAGEPDVDVIATSSTSADAVDQAAARDPDVVVMPWRLDGRTTGRELARAITAVSGARLVIFTGFVIGVDLPDEPVPGAVLVSKTATPEALLGAIRTAAGGHRERPGVAATTPQLTRREQQILRLLLQGLSNSEIAGLLTIEVSTVKTHVRGILRKFGAGSRRDLRGHVASHREGHRRDGVG